MDFTIVAATHGRYYMPSSPPPEPDGMRCWPKDLWGQFEDETLQDFGGILIQTGI